MEDSSFFLVECLRSLTERDLAELTVEVGRYKKFL